MRSCVVEVLVRGMMVVTLMLPRHTVGYASYVFAV